MPSLLKSVAWGMILSDDDTLLNILKLKVKNE